MKKIYALAVSAILLLNHYGHAQCTVNATASNDTVCAGQTISLTANYAGPPNQLISTFAAGNNHRGNMFDIFATNPVTITSFDAHPMGNTTIAVYFRTSPYAGFESSSAGWTLIGSAAVVAQPMGNPTPVPVPINVTIPAGQTYSFYVTSTNTAVSLNYTDGTTEGTTFTSDANITFRQGVGMEYPFTNGTGLVFRPRIWNGVIHYNTTLGSPTYLWSTGAVTGVTTEVVNATTAYSVEVNIPGCPTPVHDTIDIFVPTPTVAGGPDFAICTGDSATLTGSGTGIPPLQFFWDNAVANNVPFQPFATSPYIVMVMDGVGCTATDTVVVTLNPLPLVQAGNDTTICNNSMFTFNGSGAATYAWNNGVTDGVPYPVMMTMTFEVTGTDSNGCVGRDTITVISDTVDVSVTVVNETITANDSAATYQWINCDSMTVIAGATSQSYTATANGTYAVIVNNGLCSDTSACELILSTGIAGNSSLNAVTVFPNPTSNEFTVNTGSFVAEEILVTDVLGKVIARIQPSATQVNVSLENNSAGIYFVRVTSAEHHYTVRVVKN